MLTQSSFLGEVKQESKALSFALLIIGMVTTKKENTTKA